MNRFSEGKACDAVIRHIEAREGNARQDVRSPEQQGDVAPVEISCSIGGQLFVFEHTGIEPFEGQIEIEAQGHFKPLKRFVRWLRTSKRTIQAVRPGWRDQWPSEGTLESHHLGS